MHQRDTRLWTKLKTPLLPWMQPQRTKVALPKVGCNEFGQRFEMGLMWENSARPNLALAVPLPDSKLVVLMRIVDHPCFGILYFDAQL